MITMVPCDVTNDITPTKYRSQEVDNFHFIQPILKLLYSPTPQVDLAAQVVALVALADVVLTLFFVIPRQNTKSNSCLRRKIRSGLTVA